MSLRAIGCPRLAHPTSRRAPLVLGGFLRPPESWGLEMPRELRIEIISPLDNQIVWD
jgi:hypothetical protein